VGARRHWRQFDPQIRRRSPHSLAVLVDSTEQLRVQRTLRDAEERYRSLVELSPVPIGVHRDGVAVYANAAMARLLGAESPERLVGAPLGSGSPGLTAGAPGRARRAEDADERDGITEERWVRLDGTTVDVEVATREIPLDGGMATQVVAIDVTPRKRAEEALRQRAAQEQLLRAQEELLRALSTPLIPVGERVVVMPLVGRIDALRAERILETLLAGITS
jgi:rsbT co-antagonist protein RsbR